VRGLVQLPNALTSRMPPSRSRSPRGVIPPHCSYGTRATTLVFQLRDTCYYAYRSFDPEPKPLPASGEATVAAVSASDAGSDSSTCTRGGDGERAFTVHVCGGDWRVIASPAPPGKA